MRIVSLLVYVTLLSNAVAEASTTTDAVLKERIELSFPRSAAAERRHHLRSSSSRRTQLVTGALPQQPPIGGNAQLHEQQDQALIDSNPVPLALQPQNIIGILPVQLPQSLQQALTQALPQSEQHSQAPQKAPQEDVQVSPQTYDQSVPGQFQTEDAVEISQELQQETVPTQGDGGGGGGSAAPTQNGGGGGGGNKNKQKQADKQAEAGGDGRIDDNDDGFSNLAAQDDLIAEEIQQEERKVRTLGGFGFLLAVVAMIFTAWQMSDHPDGIYAAMCRLLITIIGLFVRILLTPCRSCLGGLNGSRHYGEHMPVSTMDYGYRDPALELS